MFMTNGIRATDFSDMASLVSADLPVTPYPFHTQNHNFYPPYWYTPPSTPPYIYHPPQPPPDYSSEMMSTDLANGRPLHFNTDYSPSVHYPSHSPIFCNTPPHIYHHFQPPPTTPTPSTTPTPPDPYIFHNPNFYNHPEHTPPLTLPHVFHSPQPQPYYTPPTSPTPYASPYLPTIPEAPWCSSYQHEIQPHTNQSFPSTIQLHNDQPPLSCFISSSVTTTQFPCGFIIEQQHAPQVFDESLMPLVPVPSVTNNNCHQMEGKYTELLEKMGKRLENSSRILRELSSKLVSPSSDFAIVERLDKRGLVERTVDCASEDSNHLDLPKLDISVPHMFDESPEQECVSTEKQFSTVKDTEKTSAENLQYDNGVFDAHSQREVNDGRGIMKLFSDDDSEDLKQLQVLTPVKYAPEVFDPNSETDSIVFHVESSKKVRNRDCVCHFTGYGLIPLSKLHENEYGKYRMKGRHKERNKVHYDQNKWPGNIKISKLELFQPYKGMVQGVTETGEWPVKNVVARTIKLFVLVIAYGNRRGCELFENKLQRSSVGSDGVGERMSYFKLHEDEYGKIEVLEESNEHIYDSELFAKRSDESLGLKELKSKTLRFIPASHLHMDDFKSILKCVRVLRDGDGDIDNHPSLSMKAWLGIGRFEEAETKLKGMVVNKGIPEVVWVSAVELYFQEVGTAGAETANGIFLGILGRCHVRAGAANRVVQFPITFQAKKLINNPEDVVLEFIEGLVETYSELQYLDGFPEVKVVLHSYASSKTNDKVAVISEGGSGHELDHAEIVGEGMLTAAKCGNVFASPSVDAILAGIGAVTGPMGCLLIVKNYSGDRLNFGLASEQAKSEGYKVDMVIIGDDCALLPPGGIAGRGGLVGTILVHKFAGAAAASGLSLAGVAVKAKHASEMIRTKGVALSVCTLPGQVSFDRLGPGKMELGLGIHGKPDAAVTDIQSVDSVVSHVYHQILSSETNYLSIKRGSRLILVINGIKDHNLLGLVELCGSHFVGNEIALFWHWCVRILVFDPGTLVVRKYLQIGFILEDNDDFKRGYLSRSSKRMILLIVGMCHDPKQSPTNKKPNN